jgi:hypothetical protein
MENYYSLRLLQVQHCSVGVLVEAGNALVESHTRGYLQTCPIKDGGIGGLYVCG